MYYRNEEEVKPFDLIAVSYPNGIAAGIVRSVGEGQSLQFYAIVSWDSSNPLGSCRDFITMKKHLNGTSRSTVSYIYGNTCRRRIVKIVPDQLSRTERIVYNEMQELIKTAYP